jgi:hypothetical protein
MAIPAQSNELPHEEGLSRPVVVVDWDEMMKKKAQWVEENAEKLRERDNDLTVTSIHGFFDTIKILFNMECQRSWKLLKLSNLPAFHAASSEFALSSTMAHGECDM